MSDKPLKTTDSLVTKESNEGVRGAHFPKSLAKKFLTLTVPAPLCWMILSSAWKAPPPMTYETSLAPVCRIVKASGDDP